MISRMAVRGILFLTLFTGMCVAQSKVNLALRAAAVQSATQENYVAERAVDGNTDPILAGGSCSQTKEDMKPWWRVDLLKEYDITRVVITNRKDAEAEKINGAQIRIGNNLIDNGNENQLAATVVSIPPGDTQTFEFNPIKGQYVNIFIPGRSEHLTLCEVEVYADQHTPPYICVPRNLALRATAVQSSSNDSYGAERAVDGNRNPILLIGSCSETKEDLSPWWRVDLLSVYAVTRVSITNRGDGGAAVAGRIHGAQIRIGNSLENNGNYNELAATVGSMTLGETKSFEFKPTLGRYVNIFIPGRKEFLTLCEVEVFAD